VNKLIFRSKKGFFFVSAVFLFLSCGTEITNISRPLLGTFVTITIDAEPAASASASSAAFDEITRIEKVFSIYDPRSGMSVINSKAQYRPVIADDEIFSLIKLSADISKKTSGAFDMTFASMGKLWNFSTEKFIPPAPDAVKKILPAFNYRNVLFDDSKKTVRFLNSGTKIGLGGIAKGYAVKRAVDILRKEGVTNGIVACAGDIQVIGSKRGSPWVVGVRHPREKDIIASLKLYDNESISTSGDYERYKYYNGKRFHHIINPATGYPSESGIISATVLCNDPVLADAYATAVFVMGVKSAQEFLKKERDISVVLITDELKIYVSEKLRGRIDFRDNLAILYF